MGVVDEFVCVFDYVVMFVGLGGFYFIGCSYFEVFFSVGFGF